MTVTLPEIKTPETIEFHDVTHDELSFLAKLEGPCVTIFLDTYICGPETVLNSKQLERLLPKTQEQLEDFGLSKDEIDKYLKPLQNLINDDFEWQHMSEGLVLCLNPFEAIGYKVSHDVPMQVTVGSKHKLHYLVQELDRSQKYFILSVTQDDVRLLKADDSKVERVQLRYIPESLSAALPEGVGKEPGYQGNSVSASRVGNSHGVETVHGHDVSDIFDVQVEKFLNDVGKNLIKELGKDKGKAVILATVPNYISAIKNSSGYENFSDEVVNGSYSHLSDHELHELAKPIFEKVLERYKAGYEEVAEKAASEKKFTTSLDDSLELSREYRIDTLIVSGPDYNTVDEITGEFDVYDELISNTLVGGGKVVFDEYLITDVAVISRY